MIHPAVTYTVARLALVGVAAGGLYLVGFRSWPLAFAAVLVSLPLSWFLLRPLRDKLSDAIEEHSRKRAEEKAKLRQALNGEDGNRDDESGERS